MSPQEMIEEAKAAMERRRNDLVMLEDYRKRLVNCVNISDLIDVLSARAVEINKSISEDIARDQVLLDEMIASSAIEIRLKVDPL